jgi:hypothetical protein
VLIQSECRGHYLSFDDEKHKYTLDGNPVPGGSTFTKSGYPTSEGLISWSMGRAATFAAERAWQYGLDGVKPTQTAIKELVKASKKKPAELATAAAAIGTIVHDYAYWFEKGETAKCLTIEHDALQHPDGEKIKNGIGLFLNWHEKVGAKDTMVASEDIVGLPCNNHGENVPEHSLCYCYAGKFDRLVSRPGVGLVLSDFKTSSGIYVEQFLQEGAYTPAIEFWMGERLQGEKIAGLEILRFGKEDGKFEAMLISDPDEINAIVRQALVCRMTYAFRRKWEMDKRFKFHGKVAK